MINKRLERVRKSHDLRDRLSINTPEYQAACLNYFKVQLALDLPKGEKDITSHAILKKGTEVQAICRVKEPGIIAGIEELLWFFKQQSGFAEVFSDCFDGEYLTRGRAALFLRGDALAIMKWERVIVNFLQRMSGLATYSHKIIEKALDIAPDVLVCPTRKTLMGPLDKRAVNLAGAGTHRVYLSDAVLIKENHIMSSNLDLKSIIGKVLVPGGSAEFFEFEAESKEQALEIAKLACELQKTRQISTPIGIMLDNFSAPSIQATLNNARELGVHESLFWEASGGIAMENMDSYLKTGVDIISMGALTNRTHALDISMRINEA